MNFSLLFPSIGSLILSLLASTASHEVTPIPSNSTVNITTTLLPSNSTENITTTLLPSNSTENITTATNECFFYHKRFINLDHTDALNNSFSNCHKRTMKCRQRRGEQLCAATIHKLKKNSHTYNFYLKCLPKKLCDKTASSAWKYLDYDLPLDRRYNLPFIFHECCVGNKCNTIENLPRIKKILTSRILLEKDHDKLCPGYSNNNQKILVNIGEQQNVDINKSNNLLLEINILKYRAHIEPENKYTEMLWYLSTKLNSHNPQELFSFDATGEMQDPSKNITDTSIKNNTFFYATTTSIHICNITKEDDSYIIHVTKLENGSNITTTIKMISSAADISTTANTETSSYQLIDEISNTNNVAIAISTANTENPTHQPLDTLTTTNSGLINIGLLYKALGLFALLLNYK